MTELDEVKQVLIYKIPMFVLGALVGLGIVWIALQFIPGVAMTAVSGLSP